MNRININPQARAKRVEISNLSFLMVKTKIRDQQEGEKWTGTECDLGEQEYKRFLTLILLYPSEALVPNKFIDTFWHYHILDTQKYLKDTINIFGDIVHHYPYLGMNGDEDKELLERLFLRTKELYRKEFGEDMKTPARMGNSASCSRGCSARCSNILERLKPGRISNVFH